MSLLTTAPSYAAGQILTAAQLNALQDGIQAPWDAYTVQWTAGTTNPTLGNGSLVGRFLQIGKLIHFSVQLQFGTTTTIGSGNYFWSLPVTAKAGTNTPFLGTGRIPGGYRIVALGSTTQVTLNTEAAAVVGSGTSAWTSGNIISLLGVYEAA